MPNFNYDDISFATLQPEKMDDQVFADLHTAKVYAYEQALFASGKGQVTYKDFLKAAGDDETYKNEHLDLDLLVQRLGNENQEFAVPYFAIAYCGNVAIGGAFSADNASGANHMIRRSKMLSIAKNYRALNDIFVKPEFQGRGIAHGLAYLSFLKRLPYQPASAYTWPELLPHMDGLLKSWSLNPTNAEDPDIVHPFNPGVDVEQIRYEARPASKVLDTLESLIPEEQLKVLRQSTLNDLLRTKP